MKKELLKICFKPLTWLNKIIPKNQRQIFFYSNLGFRDNVRAVFDYIIDNEYNKEYRIVCAVNEHEEFIQLKNQESHKLKWHNVKFVSTKSGILYFLRSKYGFYSFGKYPIKPTKKQVIVNVWHGMPLKTLGNTELGCEKVDYNYFTYLIATSDFFSEIMMRCFNCNKEQILINGQPRNDELFWNDEQIDLNVRKDYEKVILWLPTYRNTTKMHDESQNRWPVPLISEDEAKVVNNRLAEVNVKLIIKLHPLQFGQGICQFSNISIMTQEDFKGKSLYAYLRNSDALITDYSSVYFDYMLLDRPIGFTLDDMEKYSGDRGFVFDNPLEYMPGEDIRNLDDMLKFINDVCLGMDKHKGHRDRINDIVNKHKDGNATEMLCDKIFK